MVHLLWHAGTSKDAAGQRPWLLEAARPTLSCSSGTMLPMQLQPLCDTSVAGSKPCSMLHSAVCRCAMLLLLRVLRLQFCHAFVGYLEEEAVKTYTQALQVSDWLAGRLLDYCLAWCSSCNV
jgi:hypothetical protein